jgi:hypothetical protein
LGDWRPVTGENYFGAIIPDAVDFRIFPVPRH